MERDSMLIYKSFIDVSDDLNDKDYRLFWDAIHKYGVYGQNIPQFENHTLNALMVLIQPLLKANIRNYENGKKGGAPKGNRNAKTTEKQPGVKPVVESGLNKKTTQKQGNVNVNDNANDNDTDTVTDNDNVNDNVNVNDNISPLNPPVGDFIPDDEDDDENGKWMTGEELLAKYGSGRKKK